MLKGIYNSIKNSHALNVLQKNPEVIGGTIGVGDSVLKASLPNTILKRIIYNQQNPTLKENKTLDDIKYVGTGKQINVKDFPKSFYIGEVDTFGT